MPIYSLNISTRTQNISEISAPKETIWLLKIKCTACNTTFPKEVGVSLTQQAELDKQHGLANFSAKCKQCSRKGFITILKTSAYALPIEEDGVVKGIFANFQCRGIEIQECVLSNYFTVKVRGSSNSFQEADFSDLWCEYDDNISAVAQVEDAKFDIVLSKEK